MSPPSHFFVRSHGCSCSLSTAHYYRAHFPADRIAFACSRSIVVVLAKDVLQWICTKMPTSKALHFGLIVLCVGGGDDDGVALVVGIGVFLCVCETLRQRQNRDIATHTKSPNQTAKNDLRPRLKKKNHSREQNAAPSHTAEPNERWPNMIPGHDLRHINLRFIMDKPYFTWWHRAD